MDNRFTVFVGDGEVNSYLLPKGTAISIAEDWKEEGYDDVVVCEVIDGEYIPITY